MVNPQHLRMKSTAGHRPRAFPLPKRRISWALRGGLRGFPSVLVLFSGGAKRHFDTHRIHGTWCHLPSFTIRFNHSCRYKYTIDGSYVYIYIIYIIDFKCELATYSGSLFLLFFLRQGPCCFLWRPKRKRWGVINEGNLFKLERDIIAWLCDTEIGTTFDFQEGDTYVNDNYFDEFCWVTFCVTLYNHFGQKCPGPWKTARFFPA